MLIGQFLSNLGPGRNTKISRVGYYSLDSGCTSIRIIIILGWAGLYVYAYVPVICGPPSGSALLARALADGRLR